MIPCTIPANGTRWYVWPGSRPSRAQSMRATRADTWPGGVCKAAASPLSACRRYPSDQRTNLLAGRCDGSSVAKSSRYVSSSASSGLGRPGSRTSSSWLSVIGDLLSSVAEFVAFVGGNPVASNFRLDALGDPPLLPFLVYVPGIFRFPHRLTHPVLVVLGLEFRHVQVFARLVPPVDQRAVQVDGAARVNAGVQSSQGRGGRFCPVNRR